MALPAPSSAAAVVQRMAPFSFPGSACGLPPPASPLVRLTTSRQAAGRASTTASPLPELTQRDPGWHASHPLSRPNTIPSSGPLSIPYEMGDPSLCPSLARLGSHHFGQHLPRARHAQSAPGLAEVAERGQSREKERVPQSNHEHRDTRITGKASVKLSAPISETVARRPGKRDKHCHHLRIQLTQHSPVSYVLCLVIDAAPQKRMS